MRESSLVLIPTGVIEAGRAASVQVGQSGSVVVGARVVVVGRKGAGRQVEMGRRRGRRQLGTGQGVRILEEHLVEVGRRLEFGRDQIAAVVGRCGHVAIDARVQIVTEISQGY